MAVWYYNAMPTRPNPLFDTGFPGPAPAATEIDTLPSRIAQAAGVRDAAVKRGQALAEQVLAGPESVAGDTVDMMLTPLSNTLSDAGTTAAHAVATGQLGTVKALQAPLSAAVQLGYVSKGTPLLSPAGQTRKKKNGRAAAAPFTLANAAPPVPSEVSQTWTIFFHCTAGDVAAIPDGALTGPYVGWRPPSPWAGGYGFTGTHNQLLQYLQKFGLQMFTSTCPNASAVV